MTVTTSKLQNQFLIAMPQMADPNFNGTVTYICDHSDEGAMGIVINRPLDLTLRDIFESLDVSSDESDIQVYGGGPVQVDRGFVLHQGQGEWRSTVKVADNVFLTTSKDILMAFSKHSGPAQCIIALGYAGWGAGQLEHELSGGCWLTCPADGEVLFNTPSSSRFHAAMSILGIDLSQLSGQVGHC